MKAAAGLAVAVITTTWAHAQEAVQWRAQDGGNGHWYQFVAAQAEWPFARQAARARGGELASIVSSAEGEFIRSVCASPTAWIGACQDPDACEPGCGWRWSDGSSWEYQNWDPQSGEPNDGGCCWRSNEDVGEIRSGNGRWNDYLSRGVLPAIVEWSADCNGDGIVDHGQILAGQLADADGNGIPDGCESGLQPIHAYDFQTSARDRLGGADGALANGAMISSGALLTDGLNDHVQFPGQIIPTSGPFTVALRFKTLSVPPGWMELISQGCSGCGAFYLGRALNGQWRYWLDDAGVQTGVPFPIDGAWHHVAATYRPGGVTRLYVDGVPVGEYPATPLSAAGGPTRLACQFDLHENYHGFIDDLRIYDAELSAAQVAGLAGTCIADIVADGSINGADLGILLSQWGVVVGESRSDIDRDGSVGGPDLAILLSSWGACP